MWWSPSYERQTEESVWTAFATGDWARELLLDGEASALQKGLATFRRELNRPDLIPTTMKIANWGGDPFALGGYSASRVGGSTGRAELAQPVAGKLFWAGEATASILLSTTVHGAYLTGKRAATEVLAFSS
jgi:monoamine oxidase